MEGAENIDKRKILTETVAPFPLLSRKRLIAAIILAPFSAISEMAEISLKYRPRESCELN